MLLLTLLSLTGEYAGRVVGVSAKVLSSFSLYIIMQVCFVLYFHRSTVKPALPNTQNDCYQWPCNSSSVLQIRFRPGLRSGPR